MSPVDIRVASTTEKISTTSTPTLAPVRSWCVQYATAPRPGRSAGRGRARARPRRGRARRRSRLRNRRSARTQCGAGNGATAWPRPRARCRSLPGGRSSRAPAGTRSRTRARCAEQRLHRRACRARRRALAPANRHEERALDLVGLPAERRPAVDEQGKSQRHGREPQVLGRPGADSSNHSIGSPVPGRACRSPTAEAAAAPRTSTAATAVRRCTRPSSTRLASQIPHAVPAATITKPSSRRYSASLPATSSWITHRSPAAAAATTPTAATIRFQFSRTVRQVRKRSRNATTAPPVNSHACGWSRSGPMLLRSRRGCTLRHSARWLRSQRPRTLAPFASSSTARVRPISKSFLPAKARGRAAAS